MAGEMASGFAHELNQPLSTIVQYMGGCIQRLSAESSGTISPEIIGVMQQIETQAERAGAIIHRLKNFLRKDSVYKTLIDVHELINETLQLLHSKIQENGVEVELHFCLVSSMLLLDKIQIQQVFSNIILNAIEAMLEIDIDSRKIIITTLVDDSDEGILILLFLIRGRGSVKRSLSRYLIRFSAPRRQGWVWAYRFVVLLWRYIMAR